MDGPNIKLKGNLKFFKLFFITQLWPYVEFIVILWYKIMIIENVYLRTGSYLFDIVHFMINVSAFWIIQLGKEFFNCALVFLLIVH